MPFSIYALCDRIRPLCTLMLPLVILCGVALLCVRGRCGGRTSLVSILLLALGLAPGLMLFDAGVQLIPVVAAMGLLLVFSRPIPARQETVKASFVVLGLMAFAMLTWPLWVERFTETPGGVALKAPLSGTTVVVQGGVTRAVNHHAPFSGQRWAVDLVAPYKLSDAWFALLGKTQCLSGYGLPIKAPCAGRVLGFVDHYADLPIGKRDVKHPMGNFVVLHCTNTSPESVVILEHLRRGSVLVARNRSISRGSVVGEVGNSGNTSYPHLHIAARTYVEGHPSQGEDLPLHIDGQFPRRFDVFNFLR